jgi:NADH-quinone oxidoreductase subunit C
VNGAVPAEWLDWVDGHGSAFASDAEGMVLVDVAPDRWRDVVASARDDLGAAWFDALTVVDEGDRTFSVVLGLAVLGTPLQILHLRTRVGGDPPTIASVDELFAGAGWCQREAAEMFGIRFDGATDDRRLLLPPAFVGTPLRKEAVLPARGTRPWPGAKEPGESDADLAAAPGSVEAGSDAGSRRRRRRRTEAPGVPARDDEGRW